MPRIKKNIRRKNTCTAGLSSTMIVGVEGHRKIVIQLFSKIVKNKATLCVGWWSADQSRRRWHIVMLPCEIWCLLNDHSSTMNTCIVTTNVFTFENVTSSENPT
jgi:hypothetical protein